MKAWVLAATSAVVLSLNMATWQAGRPGIKTALAESESLVVHDRFAARWQSLDLTARTLANGTSPADWDASVFLNIDALNKLLNQIVGSKIVYAEKGLLAGTVIDVAGIRLLPRLGALDAELDLVATKSGISLPLTAAATVTFQGIAQAAPGKLPLLTLRVEPTEVAPHTGFAALDVVARGFWDRLLPDLGILLADRRLFDLQTPVPDHIDIPLGLQKQDTVSVNGGGGSVSYAANMVPGSISQGIGYIGPVFTDKGLWLRAQLDNSNTGLMPLAPKDTTGIATAELKTRVTTLEAALAVPLASMAIPTGSAALHIGKAVFLSLADKLQHLDPAQRRITLTTTGQNGSLAGHRQSLGVLGNIGIQASLIDNSGSGQIQFTFGQSIWSDKGFTLPINVAMHAQASVELNIDVIASGIVHTSVGVLGDGGVSIAPSAKPVLVGAGGERLAALQLSGTCASVHADIRTNGVLKTDFGWTKVPSIGGRVTAPLGPILPVLLLDSRSQFVRLPNQAIGTWQFVPHYPAVKLAITPASLVVNSDGTDLVVDISSEPVAIQQDSPTRDADLSAAEERARGEAAAVKTATDAQLQTLAKAETCPQNSEFALLLGNLEFGPNNELVKVLIFIGKLTGDALKEAQRLGGEVSPEKIKGWIDNPGDSLHRSELGRQADHITHELAPEKAKEWLEHPADSARRGEPGRIVCGVLHC
jgi:hypothetical protein